MTQQEKKVLWDELKAAGVEFPKHYREYSTSDLEGAVQQLHEMQEAANEEPDEEEEVYDGPAFIFPEKVEPAPRPQDREPDKIAGIRQNQDELEAIRVDPDTNWTWYQDEVRKPAMATPRARRVLKYVDPGVRKQEVVDANGSVIETFEMPGDEQRQSEVKITMPSFQVGIYKRPDYPFKVHVYNSKEGFDYFEVADYFNGPDLVPESIKRIYVSASLCFDIRTTIREIEKQYRETVLKQGAFQ